MTTIDWIAIGFVAFFFLAFAGAFFLYLRNAYRREGWKGVRTHAIIAIVAIVAFGVFNALRRMN